METEKIIYAYSLEELPEMVTKLLTKLRHPLVLFIGDLGAGKTTLIKELVSQLGSVDAGSSPSYSLINEYKTEKDKLYHLDLYRLNSPEEAFALGLEDILYSGAYCLVEWPQLIMDYLEPPYHIIQLSLTSNGGRELSLSEVANDAV